MIAPPTGPPTNVPNRPPPVIIPPTAPTAVEPIKWSLLSLKNFCVCLEIRPFTSLPSLSSPPNKNFWNFSLLDKKPVIAPIPAPTNGPPMTEPKNPPIDIPPIAPTAAPVAPAPALSLRNPITSLALFLPSSTWSFVFSSPKKDLVQPVIPAVKIFLALSNKLGPDALDGSSLYSPVSGSFTLPKILAIIPSLIEVPIDAKLSLTLSIVSLKNPLTLLYKSDKTPPSYLLVSSFLVPKKNILALLDISLNTLSTYVAALFINPGKSPLNIDFTVSTAPLPTPLMVEAKFDKWSPPRPPIFILAIRLVHISLIP